MHRNPVLATFAILLLGPLAGCVADPEAAATLGTDTAPPAPGNAADAAPGDPGARPTWTHGDWFEFDVKFDNTYVALETRDRVVVNRADENGYQLGAGNRDLGVIDSHFDDFFVGDIDADLNANLGNPAVAYRMFDWPLTAGKAWKTSLPIDPFTQLADEVTLTASAVAKVDDPRGEGPGFRVEGTSTLGYGYHFVYSSRTQWITEFTKTAPDGRIALSLTLADSGSNYEGVFHLVTKKTLYERVVIWPFFVFVPEFGPVPPADTLSISEDFTFVQEILAAFTFNVPANGSQPEVQGGGAFHIQVQYPDASPGETRSMTHTGTGNSQKIEINDLEPYPKGSFAIAYGGGGVGGMYVAYHGFNDEIVEFGTQSHANHKM